MKSYDFSQIDFSEIATELACVYSILLERAKRRKQQQRHPEDGVLSVVSSPQETVEETAKEQNIPAVYVQEQMFLEEVCDG